MESVITDWYLNVITAWETARYEDVSVWWAHPLCTRDCPWKKLKIYKQLYALKNNWSQNKPKLTRTTNISIMFWISVAFKRTSVQKSNKNEIFIARVKNSNCLNFCTQVDPSKTRKAVYFFPLKYVVLFEKNELFAFTLWNRWIGL